MDATTQEQALPTTTNVKWRTREYEEEKEGKIIGIIPARESPKKRFPFLAKVSSTQCKLGNGIDGGSIHDRYLIEVPRQHKRDGSELVSFFYAPKKSLVDLQNPQ